MIRYSVKPINTMLWFLLLGLSITTLLSCTQTMDNQKTLIATDTPTMEGLPIPNNGKFMPGRLDCSYITETEVGPSWNGLTIGVSTLEEVQMKLHPVDGKWDSKRVLWFSNPEYQFSENNAKDWRSVSACFVENSLSALNVQPPSFPDIPYYLDEWMTEFGNPDRVTWANSIDDRSVIWAEEGFLVVFDLHTSPRAKVTRYGSINVILFPPITKDNLEDSWLLAALPSEKPLRTDLPPISEFEDPWGIVH